MTQGPPLTDGGQRLPRPGAAVSASVEEAHPAELEAGAEVAEFFSALDKALRARRLYQPNNPVYQGFLTALDSASERLWLRLHSLQVAVEEQVFRWYNRSFTCGEGREALPFLFYKDGVRFLTFLPGFENEVERFLGVLYRARQLDQRSDDDIVTLLWQAEFVNFQYTYVDALAEGLEVPEGRSITRSVQRVPKEAVAADVAAPRGSNAPFAVQQGQPPVPQAISRSDFSETLYFLDHRELDALKREVEQEMVRDVRTDVLNALFDRLEEQNQERQSEIIGILRQLLPTFLGAGELVYATRVLTELNAVIAKGALGEAERSAAEAIYRELSEPAVLSQLLMALENGSIDASGDDLGIFLSHLGPAAMPLLLRSIETSNMVSLQERLRVAMQQLADRHRSQLVAMLRSESPEVVRGAARLVAQMGLLDAVPILMELLRSAPVDVRRLAVEALTQLKSSVALEALRPALQDADREVRIAAVRGLAAAKYIPARPSIEEVVRKRDIRDVDLTEKMAFFEAFGAMAAPEHVELLDKLLNGRRLLGKEPPEVRACAAMALGRVSSPAARAALHKASADSNPIVRNAVAKALRQEVSA